MKINGSSSFLLQLLSRTYDESSDRFNPSVLGDNFILRLLVYLGESSRSLFGCHGKEYEKESVVCNICLFADRNSPKINNSQKY